MPTNELERTIFKGALRAHQIYETMTGWWLWHGPWSFLQHEVASSISRTEHYVFTEASPRKIAHDLHRPLRGRPTKVGRTRFDVVVWYKSSNTVRAIVEIKRANTTAPVVRDAKKLKHYVGMKNTTGIGYRLVYSEARGTKHKAQGSS